jgi:hypothetical protein
MVPLTHHRWTELRLQQALKETIETKETITKETNNNNNGSFVSCLPAIDIKNDVKMM